MSEKDEEFQATAVNGAEPPTSTGAFAIQTLQEAHHFGKFVVDSGFYPAFKRASQVVVALQIAHDNGVPFSLVAANIAFINNRASMYGDALIGIAHASQGMEDFRETLDGEGDDLTAVCEIQRQGIKTPIRRTFSVDDAKRAHLWPGTERPNQKARLPWVEYPRRMLQMRARSWALRDAGLVQGVIAPEEAEDIPANGLMALPAPEKPEKKPDPKWSAIIKGEDAPTEPNEASDEMQRCPDCGEELTEDEHGAACASCQDFPKGGDDG